MGRRAMELAEADPKGLVRESYRIEGITPGECRSIFMDWALSIPVGSWLCRIARARADRELRCRGAPDHPMTAVLTRR